MKFSIDVNSNGSFNIKMGNMKINDCFPGLNKRVVHPVDVKVKESKDSYKIIYQLGDVEIDLKILLKNDYEIVIKSSLIQNGKTFKWFHPIFSAEMHGVDGIFKQGLGMGGPSGYCSLKKIIENHDKVESYGVFSLCSNNGEYIVIAGDNHSRFLNSYGVDILQSDEIRENISCGFRLEKVKDMKIDLPDIYITSTNDLENGLQKAAKKIAKNMKARTHREPSYHWCSWYYLYNNLSHSILLDYLDGFSKMTPHIPLKYIQIDAGYFPSAGDWLIPNHLWPNGMKAAFDDIRKYGYEPGIWIAPYMVGNRSKLYKEHPDWILYDLNGKPVVPMKFYNEPQIWGYLDEEYFVLDTSHPDAMEYIRNVFKEFKKMGVKFFKTDFMKFGFQDSTKVKRYTPGKTSVEYFRDLLQVIREEIGEDSYWLGCIAPFLPFIGYADGMRIAGDVGAQWDENDFGPVNMIREVPADNYFNNIYWQNDPDCMMLRNFHIYLNKTEVESLALLQAVSGGIVSTSDPLHEIAKERTDLFRFVEPREKIKTKNPLLGKEAKEIIFVNEIEKFEKYNIFIFNPTDEVMIRELNIEELTGISGAYTRLWNTKQYSTDLRTSVIAKIEPHGCNLFFISKSKVLNKEVKNIWNWYK